MCECNDVLQCFWSTGQTRGEMSWNSILHLRKKHALIAGERSLKWEARSNLQDFLSIKVSSVVSSMKFIVGITHHSNRNACSSCQNARGAKSQCVLGWCSVETRGQRKRKMCLVPETPPESYVDFIASWGGIMFFWIAVLCSTGRWWHKYLDIQEEGEVEGKYMVSLDTKHNLLIQISESCKMLVLNVQELYSSYFLMLREHIICKDGVD